MSQTLSERVRALFDAIGRADAADALRVSNQRISDTIRDGRIPASYFHVLDRLGRERGVAVSRDLFSFRQFAGTSAPVNEDNNPVTGLQSQVGE